MKKTKDEVGELRELKKSSGKSNYKIARDVGVYPQSIRNWLSGRNKPSDLAIEAIKKFLDSQK